MHGVADDASNSSCSWNYLKLERNTTGQLPIRDNGLLESVLDEHWASEVKLPKNKPGMARLPRLSATQRVVHHRNGPTSTGNV